MKKSIDIPPYLRVVEDGEEAKGTLNGHERPTSVQKREPLRGTVELILDELILFKKKGWFKRFNLSFLLKGKIPPKCASSVNRDSAYLLWNTIKIPILIRQIVVQERTMLLIIQVKRWSIIGLLSMWMIRKAFSRNSDHRPYVAGLLDKRGVSIVSIKTAV